MCAATYVLVLLLYLLYLYFVFCILCVVSWIVCFDVRLLSRNRSQWIQCPLLVPPPPLCCYKVHSTHYRSRSNPTIQDFFHLRSIFLSYPYPFNSLPLTFEPTIQDFFDPDLLNFYQQLTISIWSLLREIASWCHQCSVVLQQFAKILWECLWFSFVASNTKVNPNRNESLIQNSFTVRGKGSSKNKSYSRHWDIIGNSVKVWTSESLLAVLAWRPIPNLIIS